MMIGVHVRSAVEGKKTQLRAEIANVQLSRREGAHVHLYESYRSIAKENADYTPSCPPSKHC